MHYEPKFPEREACYLRPTLAQTLCPLSSLNMQVPESIHRAMIGLFNLCHREAFPGDRIDQAKLIRLRGTDDQNPFEEVLSAIMMDALHLLW